MRSFRSLPLAHNHHKPTMPVTFSHYLTLLTDAIMAENGPNLAYLLRPTSPHGKDLVKEQRFQRDLKVSITDPYRDSRLIVRILHNSVLI